MIGNIHINGVIGDLGETPYVELSDVISQVQNQIKQGAERILVNINSVGGDCNVGHAIAEYLESISVPVDTIATQKCCSMGSRIFMIGQTRTLIDPVDFLIHNPWTSGVQGDASYLESAANELRGEEDKLIGIYSKVTGISKEGVAALMKEDKPMSAQKALELGFATHIKQQLKAVAVLKKETMDTGILSKIKQGVDSLMKKFNLEPKAMMVTDSNGTQIELFMQDGTDAAEVSTGLVAMVNGQAAPDGMYVIPDLGTTIEVTMGIVTAVNPTEAATADPSPDAEIASLKEQLAKKDEEIETYKKAMEEVSKKMEKIEAVVKLSQSKGNPPTGSTTFRKQEEHKVTFEGILAKNNIVKK